jgi:hypothetical protein
VSRATTYKWLGRYRAEGLTGLADRSSRPHHCPHALPAAQVRRVLAARRRRRQGPHLLGYHLAMDAPEPPSREARQQFESYIITFNQAAVAARRINQLEQPAA